MGTILLIDDDESILKILEKQLKAKGFEVYKASDGKQGLEATKRFRPDLVITDVAMPNMDGHEYVQAVHKTPEIKDTPILVLTAKLHTENMFKIEGVERFIPKPFETSEVLTAVEECILNRENIPQKCILVVDDEYDLVEVISKRLEVSGFEVLKSINGRTALEKATKDQPNLIIIDVMMPQMDGYTVCRLLKSNSKTKDIPIIILTARDSKDDRKMAKEVGAELFITKPFEIKNLIEHITTLMT